MLNKSQKTKTKQPNNFLEALRELGHDIKQEAKIQVTKMVTEDLPNSTGLSGILKPNESFSPSNAKKEQKEEFAENRLQSRHMQLQEEEVAKLRRVESEAKEQITAIQVEIRKLAATVGSFAQEVQVAAAATVTSPGKYHRSFFTHLKSLIIAMRKSTERSRSWMAEHGARSSKKKGHYWGQVQKSGTKYMMSQERYAVTSTG